jgi:hypothetical protein
MPPRTETAGRKPADRNPMNQRIARCVAQAAGTFEHLLTGRSPVSVTVVASGSSLVVTLHERFSPLEADLADTDGGLGKIEDFHRYLFENSFDAFRSHLRDSAGVELRGGIAHVDGTTHSVLKTFTTAPTVELFLLGRGLPLLGVPVDAHMHAEGVRVQGAGGTGAASS